MPLASAIVPAGAQKQIEGNKRCRKQVAAIKSPEQACFPVNIIKRMSP
jgi:hypothetical protein